jgi:hypothetical protein
MALSILDGNQSATTLSTIVTSGQHIPAHTVVSLGTQAIANITSAISGTSVCVGSISISGTPSVTGSVSVLNFPASQTTTFGAVTGSVSVLNFPASQAVTFGATTGSVSILNFPASQAVTFSDASLTNTQLRASAVTIGGTITVGNFPASQSVTFGQAIVSASNITGLNNSVGTDGGTPTSTNFIKIGGHQDGSNQVEHIVHVSAGGSMKVDASDSTVTFGAIRGTVTANAGTGTFIISDKGATGESTITTVTATSSFTLKAANTNRKLLSIYNEGDGTLNILYGSGTVTTANYSVKVFRGYYLTVDKYTGQVNGLFEKAGTARVTEIT